MRPWKIVLCGVAAAIGVAVALLRPGLSAAVPPDGVIPLLLPRLPALILILIGVYGLVAILLSAAGLVAAALDLRRELARTDALSEAAAALDWIAAFDATELRGLVPRLVGALPRSAIRGTTILLGSRFDRGTARAEVGHLYYLSLARSQALAALAGIAAIAALGFAQGRGGVAFLTGTIPTAAAVLVFFALLLLALLARFAIDVTVDPLIEAMTRLPWEPIDAGRLRHAIDLLDGARGDAAAGGRAQALPPTDLPERLALALEDGNRGLSQAGERLSIAAETIGLMTQSAIDALKTTARNAAAAMSDGGEARLAKLQTAVEALTAELRQSAVQEPPAVAVERDRQVLSDAVERLSAAAEAIGATTHSALGSLEARLCETVAAASRGGTRPDPAAAAENSGLRAAVEALTAELRQSASQEPAAAAVERDRQVLSDAVERLSAAAEAIGATTHSALGSLEARLCETVAAASRSGARPELAAVAEDSGLRAAVEALTAELRQSASQELPAAVLERDRQVLTDAVERMSAAAEAIGATTHSALGSLEARLSETVAAASRNGAHPGHAAVAEDSGLRDAVEAQTAELRRLSALLGAAGEASVSGAAARTAATSALGRELRRLLEDIEPPP